MLGLMQDWPLLCHKVLDHAARLHPLRRIHSYADGALHETNYAAMRSRALRGAQRLVRDGVQAGDRIATVASSTSRHMEVWYAAMGAQAVYHPVNPRLYPEQVHYMLEHAADRMVFVDPAYVPLVEGLAGGLAAVRRYVVLTDAAHMPQCSLPGAVDYETWLAEADGDHAWPSFDENTAAGLFYTSGTTGRPKGVLYSHRSIVLLSLTVSSRDMYGFSANDVVMMVVPMYHANGWSWPFTAPMNGAGLVLPGARLDGPALCEMATRHGVTLSGGVPTVWQGYLDHVARTGERPASLRRLYIGGSPCPGVMLEAFDAQGIEVVHVYGMTEMGPTGSACIGTPETQHLAGRERVDWLQRQGRAPFLVEMKLVDDAGQEQPWDDEATGNLRVRGPCVVRRYFGADGAQAQDAEGWFDTGDVARIDPNGSLRITDRSKDLIKSGGEWISSVDLENAAACHPAVQEVAAVAALHPKWDERPVLAVVLKPGSNLARDELLEHLATRVPKWWLPDAVVFVDELPHTATGKLHKSVLRERFRGLLSDG
jgi:fatty-acyl-CoA synthase